MKFAFNITKRGNKSKLYIYEYLPEANKYSSWPGLKWRCSTYKILFKKYINKLIIKYYWYKHITIPDVITVTTDTILNELNNKPSNQSEMLIQILFDIITEPEFCNIVKREKIQDAEKIINVYTFDSSI